MLTEQFHLRVGVFMRTTTININREWRCSRSICVKWRVFLLSKQNPDCRSLSVSAGRLADFPDGSWCQHKTVSGTLTGVVQKARSATLDFRGFLLSRMCTERWSTTISHRAATPSSRSSSPVLTASRAGAVSGVTLPSRVAADTATR